MIAINTDESSKTHRYDTNEIKVLDFVSDAIARPSVCLSSVASNVRALYSGD